MDAASVGSILARWIPTWLLLGGLFSLIGLAIFTYGRRQRTATHTLIGLALMGYPYFVSGTLPLVGVGVVADRRRWCRRTASRTD